jgi:hypothetical protein
MWQRVGQLMGVCEEVDRLQGMVGSSGIQGGEIMKTMKCMNCDNVRMEFNGCRLVETCDLLLVRGMAKEFSREEIDQMRKFYNTGKGQCPGYKG